MSIALPEVAS